MGPGEKGWRGSRWELTVPESYVLVYGPKAGASRPFTPPDGCRIPIPYLSLLPSLSNR